jgi:hypothetical protein
MSPAIEQGVREIPVKLKLKSLAEEFLIALRWELTTGKRYTGKPLEHTQMQLFTLKMPIGASFLPVAAQMADEIKEVTNGRFGFCLMPLYRERPESSPVADQYTAMDTATNCAARVVALGDNIRFDVALVAK